MMLKQSCHPAVLAAVESKAPCIFGRARQSGISGLNLEDEAARLCGKARDGVQGLEAWSSKWLLASLRTRSLPST